MKRKTAKWLTAVLAFTMVMTAGCGKEKGAEKRTENTETVQETVIRETEPVQGNDLDMTGYNLVWEDDFEDGISEDDWNYELHDPGWVNNELQSYVKSEENVYTKDGKLVIKPVETKDENGNTAYTSGRVNTQGKHDFTYGLFEASIKMPKGQGFLPAFWMMPTDENLYGQWPRCGEIDIAEVLGNDTGTTYGTIHYGNPHKESQGSYVLSEGDFAEEFHTYACEWNPGEIKWYVDGNLIHTANDWYSATEGLGEITFPAPFDQPYYIIFNLAVGGNWPGNPDATTDIAGATYEIDYVRVYQKDEYDENVTKPEKEITYREPDENGNYVINGDFSASEDLTDNADWKFMAQNGGEGNAEIKNNEIVISTANAGSEEYSIQLVQPDIPILKGSEYRVTFDACADEERTMKVAVTAPNAGWIRYLEDTELTLTKEKQSYAFDFTVTAENDPTGRLEFNMGKTDSTATISISNVRLEMTTEGSGSAGGKTVLSDGNYVYNANFQEGTDRVGSWDFTENDAVTYEVTPLSDGRRLHVNMSKDSDTPFHVTQKDLALTENAEYLLSFEMQAEAGSHMKVLLNGEEHDIALSEKQDTYSLKFVYSGKEGANTLQFGFSSAGDYYLDKVRVEENVMIKNGSFNAGTSGYEIFVDTSADANYVVDSLSEDNAMDFTILDTGASDWNVQLKQNNITLEKGKTYTLTFEAKSDMKRDIRVIIQGREDKGWPVYSGENIVTLSSDYQTFSTTFTMESDTDPDAFLSVCLGAVSERIDSRHRVCIDNISLEEVN